MFRWYNKSRVCYAYLSDVGQDYDPTGLLRGELPEPFGPHLLKSRWFSRGWTLQELIAPPEVIFYMAKWLRIGSRVEYSLARDIEKMTGIPEDVLLKGDSSTLSVASRMRWAAHRETTRVEDMAYCLLGLFGVNMPLLYGEGSRAFIRLQEEIIRTSDDVSIFAWTDSPPDWSRYSGLLASAPSAFSRCRQVTWNSATVHPPYQLTNKGIRIDLELRTRLDVPDEYVAILPGVEKYESGRTMTMGVYLARVGPGQYARVDTSQVDTS